MFISVDLKHILSRKIIECTSFQRIVMLLRRNVIKLKGAHLAQKQPNHLLPLAVGLPAFVRNELSNFLVEIDRAQYGRIERQMGQDVCQAFHMTLEAPVD